MIACITIQAVDAPKSLTISATISPHVTVTNSSPNIEPALLVNALPNTICCQLVDSTFGRKSKSAALLSQTQSRKL